MDFDRVLRSLKSRSRSFARLAGKPSRIKVLTKTVRAMEDCTTLVRSKQSMQLTRNVPFCLLKTVSESVQKKLFISSPQERVSDAHALAISKESAS